jgi:hypothetical protein
MSTNQSAPDTTDTGTDAPGRPDASDEAATSPHEETWVYGGVRATRTGTRAHAWISDDGAGDTLLFGGKGTHAIGASYRARVTRDGKHTTLYGTPTFLDRHLDPEQQAVLEAADTTARARLAAARAERRAARDRQLDTLLDPLRRIAASLPTRDDRTAFLAYVLRDLSRP